MTKPDPKPLIEKGKFGFAPVYQQGETNHCPGCGRCQWHIGRLLAECAFCQTAIPLAESGTYGAAMWRRAA